MLAVGVGEGGHGHQRIGDGQAEHGAGIGDHVADPFGGIARVDRDVGRSRLRHRPDREDRVEAARQCDGHDDLGARAVIDEHACQPVGHGVQLAVGGVASLVAHADPLGHALGCFRQHAGKGDRRLTGTTGDGDQFGALATVEEIDVAHRNLRRRDRRIEYRDESTREGGDRLLVENIGGIAEFGVHRAVGRVLAHFEL